MCLSDKLSYTKGVFPVVTRFQILVFHYGFKVIRLTIHILSGAASQPLSGKLIKHERLFSGSRNRSQINSEVSYFNLDVYFSVGKWRCDTRTCEANQMCESHGQCIRSELCVGRKYVVGAEVVVLLQLLLLSCTIVRLQDHFTALQPLQVWSLQVLQLSAWVLSEFLPESKNRHVKFISLFFPGCSIV